MTDKKTLEDYELALFRRIGCTDLHQQLLEVARAALMDDNRCALASAIASILNNLGIEEEVIKRFLSCQIDREEACRKCMSGCRMAERSVMH